MTQGNLFSVDGRVHCRLFPTTLKGPTLDWYYSLPANSVDSFEMLCTRFTDSKPTSASSASLHHVVQGESESLRQYMARFTKATLLIPNLHPAATRHSLLVGLKLSVFPDSLYTDLPLNMDSLRARATRYMSIKENADARKRKSQPQAVGEGSRYQKRVRHGRYNQYTPFNATRETVLQEACNLKLICLPRSG